MRSVISRLSKVFRKARTSSALQDMMDLDHYAIEAGMSFADTRDALKHYISLGAGLGLKPNRYFDAKWYAATYGLAGDPVSLLREYHQDGATTGRNPSALFDSTWYAQHYRDLPPKTNPLVHFLQYGLAEGRFPTPAMHTIRDSGLFDLGFYNTQIEVPFTNIDDAIQHYISLGASLGLKPNEVFDTAWYLQTYPDAQMGNPFAHFLRYGRSEGRTPSRDVQTIKDSGLFDLGFYNMQLAVPFVHIGDAIQHYISQGVSLGLNPNEFFDTSWYLQTYPEKDTSDRNPLLNFVVKKPGLDRNPSASFDCAWYLSNYPDVAKANMHPLLHYMLHGRLEERSTSRRVADPAIPTRFIDIMSDLRPLDPVVRFELVADVKAIDEEFRIKRTLPSAGQLVNSGAKLHDRRDVFPPQPYIARMRETGVIGGSRLLVKDAQTILSDEIATFSDAERWSVRPHRSTISKNLQIRLSLTRAYPNTIERGIHLMHEYGANYFHMLTEILPRVLLAEEAGIEKDVPFLIQDGLHPNLRQLIELLNSQKRDLVILQDYHLYRTKELVFLSDVSGFQDVYKGRRHPENSALHTEAVSMVVERIKSQFAHTTGPGHRKIYVRRGGRYRGLLNENEIEEFLVDRGFELVSLEGLTLAAQVKLFSQSSVVIAPTGAALTNIVWCPPGTKVGVLVGDHEAMPMEIWKQLGHVSQSDLLFFPCKRVSGADNLYSIHDNYTANLELFREWLPYF